VTDESFRGKPSNSHIVWTRETRNGARRKRFDYERFEKWANHHGFDFERATRVDHDRSDKPRRQHRCVFNWGKMSGETIEFGDEEWSLGEQRTPRTFIEVDTSGAGRVKGWQFETVFDVAQMRHDGPKLLIETADGETKQLDGGKFATHPRERQRGDSDGG
jgi:hypothetical protein